MRALIVHAHHEPKSFCSALFRQAAQTLSEAGHEVVIDENYQASLPAVIQRVSELKRGGVVLGSHLGAPQADPWRGFLIFRESGVEPVLRHLNGLPLASYFHFEVTELDTTLIRP